jgi:hypothetical protein
VLLERNQKNRTPEAPEPANWCTCWLGSACQWGRNGESRADSPEHRLFTFSN